MSSAARGSSPPPSRRKDPLVGRTIAGRFEILDVIARGGMGKVYLAEQTPLGRTCALKVLSPKYDGEEDPEFQKRFYLEASTASKLNHPNTVTIFDYGRDGDIYFVAMEYVRGRTLFKVLRDEGPIAESRVARIMQQVARSLREAHALGVIHRDMKPANIVLVEGGDEPDRVKVLDFGLVKDVTGREDAEDLTQQGLFMGSPKYMAPEQILGNDVSPATDVYSLGVVAYELLTGQVPFDRGTSVKTLMAHVNDVTPSLRETNPSVLVSRDMQSIISRCLAKDPADRYPDMDALLVDLTAVDGGGHLTESLRNVPIVRPTSEPPLSISGPRPRVHFEESPTRMMSDRGGPSVETMGSEPPRDVRRSSVPPSHSSAVLTHQLELAPPPRRRYGVWVALVALLGIGAGIALSLPRNDSSEAVSQPPPADAPAPEPSAGAPSNDRGPSSDRVPASGGAVQVLIASEPSGAIVHEGDRVLCKETPCNVTLEGDGPHALVLRKNGFQEARLEVEPGQAKATAKLERAAVAVPRPNPPPVAPKTPPPPAPKEGLSGYKDSPY
jgi:eukaryotic-like serine/threonine-protein kinase